MAKDEDIRVATAGSLAIMVGDDSVIRVIPDLPLGERRRICHVLVVLGAVLEELGVITELSTVTHATEVGTGGSDANQGGQGKGSFHRFKFELRFAVARGFIF